MAGRRTTAEAGPGRIVPALATSLLGATVGPQDAAAVALAERLAMDIDGGGELKELAPKLLAVLSALGMTPAARSAVVKGGDQGVGAPSTLDQLRDKRARLRDAATVDATAP